MLKIEYLPLADLKPYVNNAKLHPAEQVEQIKRSITEFGFDDPIAVWGDNTVIEGHGRLIAANELGLETVPVIRLDHLTDEQRKAYALVHNKLTMNSDFDADLLAMELDGIFDLDMSKFGFDLDDDALSMEQEDRAGNMANQYLVPPFSVLYGNKPDWLSRKRHWIDFGIRSEIGRGGETGLQYAEQSRSKPHTSGGYERSKAFKSNSRLNAWSKEQKRMRMD